MAGVWRQPFLLGFSFERLFMIKALETTYNGYRFRSRLEARWAVFFDHLGLRWEYEPEGFELGGGVRYLPDFKLLNITLTGRHVYVEVKPEGDQAAKAKMFAQKSGEWVIVLDGPPALRTYTFVAGSGAPLQLFFNEKKKLGRVGEYGEAVHNLSDYLNFSDVDAAVDAARGARFEFGQSGASK